MIKSVSIRNWKSHEHLDLDFIEGINFLVGPNAVGKTSVLEAICLALLGDLSASPVYGDLSYKSLIRDPDLDMQIRLTFSPDAEQEWTVTRSCTGAHRRSKAKLSTNGKVVEETWAGVTQRIMALFDTSHLFFTKVIFLSEGDTFEYAARPPGEALTRQIESVLGVRRLDALRSQLKDTARMFELQASDLRRELEEAKALSDEEKQTADQLRSEIANLRHMRDEVSKQNTEEERIQRSIDIEINSVERTIDGLQRIAKDWEQLFKQSMPSQPLRVIKTAQLDLESRERDALGELDKVKAETSTLEARIDLQQDVMRLIEPVEEGREAVCPVCKRDLTPTESTQIHQECLITIRRLKQEQERKQATLSELVAATDRIRSRKKALAKMETWIRQSMETGAATLDVSHLQAQLKSLRERRQRKLEGIAELRRRQNGALEQATRHQLDLEILEARVSKERRQEITQTRIASFKGQFVSELTRDSLDQALTEQRTAVLDPLMAELSRELSRFLDMDVAARLTEDAQLAILHKETGREFDFRQLSGGEKTALLVFTQMFLCKYFSNADFILLDEPLEHLDPDNRRGLIDFLVASGQGGYPKQLIVTTFEETLVRQHFDARKTKITYL